MVSWRAGGGEGWGSEGQAAEAQGLRCPSEHQGYRDRPGRGGAAVILIPCFSCESHTVNSVFFLCSCLGLIPDAKSHQSAFLCLILLGFLGKLHFRLKNCFTHTCKSTNKDEGNSESARSPLGPGSQQAGDRAPLWVIDCERPTGGR